MAIGTTAAILGAAVIGAGASVIGGSKAAKAQTQAADKSAEIEKYMYDTTRADYAPWRAAGSTALDALMKLYGLAPSGGVQTGGTNALPEAPIPVGGSYELAGSFNTPFMGQAAEGILARINSGEMAFEDAPMFVRGRLRRTGGGTAAAPATGAGTATPAAPYGGLQTSPGYQFRLDEGIKSIDRSASARGLLRSGATAMAVQRYGEGLAASEYDSYAARLAQLAGFGQSATAGTAAAGANYAQGASNAYMAAGNARASGYANTASSINSGLNNAMSAYLWTQNPWGKS